MIPRACTPLDGVVVALLLGLSGAFWNVGAGPGAAAGPAVEVISAAGTTTYPLALEQELAVAGPLGVSRVHLGTDGVRFLSSPCPLQLCVKSGTLARPGSLAACLPNRVAVRVVGGFSGQPTEAVDAVGR